MLLQEKLCPCQEQFQPQPQNSRRDHRPISEAHITVVVTMLQSLLPNL